MRLFRNIPFLKKTKLYKFVCKHVKTPYYYVPPCPECGSKMTGRFISHFTEYDDRWSVVNGLKHGEIIGFKGEEIKDEHTAFCVECNHTWLEYIPLRMYSQTAIQKEKEIRHTNELWEDITEEIKAEKKEFKKNHGVATRTISNFIGHI